MSDIFLNKKGKVPAIVVFWIALVLIFLSACNRSTVNPPGTPTQGTSPAVGTVSPASSPAAGTSFPSPDAVVSSPTSTAQVPLAILLAPPGSDPSFVEQLQALLADLAGQSGLSFETRQALTPADLQSGSTRIVVAIPPDPGVAALAAAAPGVQFLSIDMPEVTAGGNLSTIRPATSRPDLPAFLAGYLAAAITQDWRVGVIGDTATEAGKAASRAFANGVIFFCGLCRPAYPPFPIPGYPLVAELSGEGDQAQWQAAADTFRSWQVETVFVSGNPPAEPLLRFLAESGFHLISTTAPPSGTGKIWVASIGAADPLPAVRELWPGLVSGQGGQAVDLPLSLEQVNPDLLSPGRQRLVENMLADLLAGLIDTGVSSQPEP